jgi:uncharacterized membrane protein YdcZ (DUF606 family)
LQLTFVLQILATLVASLVIDHFGLQNVPKSPVNWLKITGITIVIGGAVISAVARMVDDPPTASAGMIFVFCILALISGALLPMQTTYNIRLHSGGESPGPFVSPLAAMMFMYVVAIPVVFIMCLFYSLAQPDLFYSLPERAAEVPGWCWVTALVGASFVTLGLWVVPAIGTARWMALLLAGQLISALITDDKNTFGLGRQAATALPIVGVVVVIVGATILQTGNLLGARAVDEDAPKSLSEGADLEAPRAQEAMAAAPMQALPEPEPAAEDGLELVEVRRASSD